MPKFEETLAYEREPHFERRQFLSIENLRPLTRSRKADSPSQVLLPYYTDKNRTGPDNKAILPFNYVNNNNLALKSPGPVTNRTTYSAPRTVREPTFIHPFARRPPPYALTSTSQPIWKPYQPPPPAPVPPTQPYQLPGVNNNINSTPDQSKTHNNGGDDSTEVTNEVSNDEGETLENNENGEDQNNGRSHPNYYPQCGPNCFGATKPQFGGMRRLPGQRHFDPPCFSTVIQQRNPHPVRQLGNTFDNKASAGAIGDWDPYWRSPTNVQPPHPYGALGDTHYNEPYFYY